MINKILKLIETLSGKINSWAWTKLSGKNAQNC